MNNVQMGDDEMPSRGKKVSSVQHERQKLFWRHISGSSNIKLQHPCPMVKRMRFGVYVKSKSSMHTEGIWIPGCTGASLTHPWIGPRPLVGHAAVCASASYT